MGASTNISVRDDTEMFCAIHRAVGGGPEEKRRCPELTRGLCVRRRAPFAPLDSKELVKEYSFQVPRTGILGRPIYAPSGYYS